MSIPSAHGVLRSLDDLLGYAQPSLVHGLRAKGAVESEEDAERLFTEIKKYLWMGRLPGGERLGMWSVRVDTAWHEWLQDTRAYATFCREFFGRVIAHAPVGPKDDALSPDDMQQERERFVTLYESVFSTPLASVWSDIEGVRANVRLRRKDTTIRFSLRRDEAAQEVALYQDKESEASFLMASEMSAAPALAFAVAHRVFYVRELPGLDDEDRVVLSQALLQTGTFALVL